LRAQPPDRPATQHGPAPHARWEKSRKAAKARRKRKPKTKEVAKRETARIPTPIMSSEP